ncbi:hypothetical protein T484DRAFT_1841005 [Baffinella frigidus]|nr:hypothetical protein T484DRAFT_1841005 [Cryptophyta sp. CCMP2293]
MGTAASLCRGSKDAAVTPGGAPRLLDSLTVEEVCRLLYFLGLGDSAPKFRDADFKGKDLAGASDQDLENIGMVTAVNRTRLLKRVEEFVANGVPTKAIGEARSPSLLSRVQRMARTVLQVEKVANEGMTGSALDLATVVFEGTILADVAGQALSGVLTIAKEFPFLGPIVAVLKEFKGMLEAYQEAGEECDRLVVFCVGSLGCIVKLYSGGGGAKDSSKHSLGLLDAAVKALEGLKKMVEERMKPSKGLVAKFVTFCTSGPFLEQCEEAKKHVNSAVDCLMLDVSVDTKNGVDELQKEVRELLHRTDLLADMNTSMQDVRSTVKAIEKGLHKILRELEKEEGLFTELVLQVDPALMGHALQREKMLSLAGKFATKYRSESHGDILNHGRVRLRSVGSGEIQAGLCRNPSSCTIWSSQGCGWVVGSCPIKNVFDVFKSLQVKVLNVKVVVVCHTYGARETAQRLLAAGVPVVVWINRTLMQLEGAHATKLLFDVIHPVIDAIVTGDVTDVALVQKKLHDLVGKNLAGVRPRLESAVLGVPVRVKNALKSGTVVNALELRTGSNLTSSGEEGRIKQKTLATELQLAVCDMPYPSELVEIMVQALGERNGRCGLWHIKGKGDTPFFRGRAVAFEASMTCLVNDTFAVVWRIETLADTVSLGDALNKHCEQGSSILVWIDLTEMAEWEGIKKWRMGNVSDDYRVVLLLTSGESNELQDAALQLSTQLKCDEFLLSDVKDASTSLVKAHALHEDLRFTFREESQRYSPFELVDEITFADLVAELLCDKLRTRDPGIMFADDGSKGAHQDVPIAGFFEDGKDLIITVCVRDVAFIKNLSHEVLTGVLDEKLGKSLSKMLSPADGANGAVTVTAVNLGQPAEIAGPRNITVECDLSGFAQSFERAILGMDKLTAHQTKKLEELRGPDCVHLRAPAGAGKTFVALHLILQAMFGPNGEHAANVKILFVVKNEALALFVVKWLLARCEGAVQKRRLLESVHLLYQPCEDGPRAVQLDDGRLWTEAVPAELYDMIVIDEAHHVFSDEPVRGTVEKYTAPLLATSRPDPPRDFPRFLILSDVSQSLDLNPQYPADLQQVHLTEVVRSSQRILAGAAAFQLHEGKDQPDATTCQNSVAGPPLKSVVFELAAGAEMMERYVDQTVQALLIHVAATFPRLSFHDRVAIIVTDDGFRDDFCAALKRRGGLAALLKEQVAELEKRRDAGGLAGKEKQSLEELLKKIQGVSERRFRVVDAAEASQCVPERNASVEEEQMILVDTVANFHGLERLIVVAVGLDEVGSPEATTRSRARLYCAVTRAQLFVVVVNEFLRGGLLEFLGHVELQKEHQKVDTKAVDRNAAAELMKQAEAEKLEELKSWLASGELATIAGALEKVGVKGKDDLQSLSGANFEKLMAAIEEADFDLLLKNVKGLGHGSAPLSAKELRETVAVREAQRQRQADEEARVADELSKWLDSVGLTSTAAALKKAGVKGKDDLKRLSEAKFEVLLAEMGDTNFDLLLEKVKGLGHDGAPSSAEKVRETVAAQKAELAAREAELQLQAKLARQRCKEEEARVAEELSTWLDSVGLTAAAAALKKVGVKGEDDLKRLDKKKFEVLLAALEEADFDLLLKKVKGLGHESAPSSAKELREAVAARKELVAKKRQEAAAKQAKQASLEKETEKKAGPKATTKPADTQSISPAQPGPAQPSEGGETRPLVSLTVDEVGQLLVFLQLAQAAENFRGAAVNGESLALLDDGDLLELGVTPDANRKKVLKRVKEFVAKGVPAKAIGAAAPSSNATEDATNDETLLKVANEGMTGSALDLATVVFEGTILADVAGQALSGVLTIAKEFPFLGPIVAVLKEFKGMLEAYQDAEEECGRLVVWCVAMLGIVRKLYPGGGGGDATASEDSQKLLGKAVAALTDLKDVVAKRNEPPRGSLNQVAKFWKSGDFLKQCEDAKKCVNSVLECLMMDVSIDTKKGVDELQKEVRELLHRTDLLADMNTSMQDVRSSLKAIEQGVARLKQGVDGVLDLVRELEKEEGLFMEVLFQVDPALMGHAQQREKMSILAGRFEDRYRSHDGIMLQGSVRLRSVGSGEIQAGLCRNLSSCMIWSSKGCGWVEGSCAIKDVFDVLKQQLQVKVLNLQVVVVCHTYGAKETAQQLLDAGVPVVVSINRALMQLDGASATKLLFDVIHPVIDAIVTGDVTDVALVQKKLHDLLGKNLPGVSRLESAVLGVPVRVKNARQRGTVFNELELRTGSNLTSSGEEGRIKQKKLATELQLAVCDMPYPSKLVEIMVQALGEGTGRCGSWHIKGKGDTPFFRGRAVAYEASMSGLVNDTFAVVWRIETLADTVSLGDALNKLNNYGAEKYGALSLILVWIDVTKPAEPAEWAALGKFLQDRVLWDDDYRFVLLLTSGESNELQDSALQLSTQLEFEEFLISDVKDASSSLVKAHSRHEDLRFTFSEGAQQLSPFDVVDEITFAALIAKALSGLVSGDGSKGAQQDVPIAGLYLDGGDLVVTVCIRDLTFLKNLNHAMLTGTLNLDIGKMLSLSDGVNGGATISVVSTAESDRLEQ